MTGCDSSEARVQEAFAKYEAAKAAGDIQAARIALLQLVAADDGVASYWVELGRLQLQLGAYSDAYYALQRAHELDRSNVEVAASLTQLALLSGNVDAADQRARELELLSPGHPAITLTDGYVALRRNRLDDANRFADDILAKAPFDPNGKLLKARIMIAEKKYGPAIELLATHVRTVTDDAGALQALAMLLRRKNDWQGLMSVARQQMQLAPTAIVPALTFIESALRSGEVDAAKEVSARFIGPNSDPAGAGRILDIWSAHWRTPDAIAEARRLVAQNPSLYALAFATYFNRVGAPEDAAKLLGDQPQRPVNRANSSLNALLAESMALRGQRAEAKRLLDEILEIEPDHIHALRTRIAVQLQTGAVKAAVRDAQRLVSNRPQSPPDRLLLARAYAAAGETRQFDRTLWNAFHEIPADPMLFQALYTHVTRTAGPAEAAKVAAEYIAQSDSLLTKDFG